MRHSNVLLQKARHGTVDTAAQHGVFDEHARVAELTACAQSFPTSREVCPTSSRVHFARYAKQHSLLAALGHDEFPQDEPFASRSLLPHHIEFSALEP